MYARMKKKQYFCIVKKYAPERGVKEAEFNT